MVRPFVYVRNLDLKVFADVNGLSVAVEDCHRCRKSERVSFDYSGLITQIHS